MDQKQFEQDLPLLLNVPIKYNKLRPLIWFALVNGVIIIPISLLTKSVEISLLFVFLGLAIPLFSLLMSKSNAIKSHEIRIISPDTLHNDSERHLISNIEALSVRAGLKRVPQVGIYDSPDMNAFATGRSRNNSIVALSTSLLENMDEESVTAVTAHELAHIANGDMLTMTILQGAVNAFALFITFPLKMLLWLPVFSNEKGGRLARQITVLVEFAFRKVLAFFGNLIAKAFSRRREFEADHGAAQVMGANSMIKALQSLENQEISFTPGQKEYASFKICSPKGMLDIFSTHPSIDRRIEALRSHITNREIISNESRVWQKGMANGRPVSKEQFAKTSDVPPPLTGKVSRRQKIMD